MDLTALYDSLHNLTQCRIVKADIAKILGIDPSQLRRKELAKVELKQTELKAIAEAFELPLQTIINQQNIHGWKNISFTGRNDKQDEIIKIPYWDGLPEELKIPDFTCVTAERNVIKNHWYLNPDNLCIVPMIGNKMTNYWYKINDNDILIIDKSHDFIMGNGVYFATSQNNTRFWVREMQVLVNNDVEFKGFALSGNTVRVVTKKELDDVGFKIIGKVIKNVSFRL